MRLVEASSSSSARSSAISESINSQHQISSIASGEPQHEWRDEHIELIRRTKRKLWYRLLSLCIFMHDFDPYAIFKHDDDCATITRTAKSGGGEEQRVAAAEGASGGSIGQAAATATSGKSQEHCASLFKARELRMRHTSRDELRHRLTGYLRVFSIYCTLKSVFVSVALFYYLKREQQLGTRSGLARAGGTSEWSETILRVLGNPFGALKDVAIVLYAGPAGFSTLCMVLFPLYYKRQPWDIANLRFILEPRHELKRVDAIIRARLAAISSSLQVYKSQQIERMQRKDSLARFQPSGVGAATGELEERELRYCEEIGLYLREFCSDPEELKSLRPKTFSPTNYVSITTEAQKAVLGASLLYTICLVINTGALTFSAYSNKCPRLNCAPLEAFSLAELLVLVESALIIALTNLSSTLNMSLFKLLTKNQLELIGSIKAEFSACRCAIQSFMTDGSRAPAGLSSHAVGITINGRPKVEASGEWCALRDPRDKLERQMLKSLVRLTVWTKEMRDTSRSISEQTVHPFYYVAGGILLAYCNSQFSKDSDGNSLRWFMIFVIWASFNSCAVSCADIYTRVLELERASWSVLAESSRLCRDNYYAREASIGLSASSSKAGTSSEVRLTHGKSCMFVADLWVKFVRSTSLNVDQHCSRIFNIELSYQTIIEANFYTIFIYSLTLSNQSR